MFKIPKNFINQAKYIIKNQKSKDNKVTKKINDFKTQFFNWLANGDKDNGNYIKISANFDLVLNEETVSDMSIKNQTKIVNKKFPKKDNKEEEIVIIQKINKTTVSKKPFSKTEDVKKYFKSVISEFEKDLKISSKEKFDKLQEEIKKYKVNFDKLQEMKNKKAS